MSLAYQIDGYRQRGFTQEQAEILAIMRAAAGVLFRDFPDSFLLFGGATLVLFHESPRHSADLDLLEAGAPPTVEVVRDSLANGLSSIAEALNQSPLEIEIGQKLFVKNRNGRVLFTVDINQFGPVIASDIEEHAVHIDDDSIAQVKAPSREFLLLQKSECFLLRRYVKARDAFDIYQLRSSGVALSQNLRSHLEDTLMSNEIEAEGIIERVKLVDEKRCRSELESFLPPELFNALASDGFQSLRDVLLDLYRVGSN
jgi:hypothetical protein